MARLRVGIIGAGMIGRAHARAFRALNASFQPAPAEIELTVIADAEASLAEDVRARYEVARVATSWDAVAEAKDVDLAVVALPNFQHADAVHALLAAGKHVLCEKPLANSLQDSTTMLSAAERAGVVHGVGFNLRRTPAVAAMRELLQDGVLGQVRQFTARYLTDYAASPEVPFTWRYDRKLAGSGALGDLGVHIVDLSRFLVAEVASVQGAALSTVIAERGVPSGHVTGHSRAAMTGERREVDTDDLGSFTASFINGAIGSFRFSRVASGYRNSAGFELLGELGALEFDMERAAEFQLFVQGSDEEDHNNGFRRVVVGPKHPYFAQVAAFPVTGVGYGYAETYLAQAYEFVKAIVESREYTPSFADGVAAAAVCQAVMEAASQNRAVSLSETQVAA